MALSPGLLGRIGKLGIIEYDRPEAGTPVLTLSGTPVLTATEDVAYAGFTVSASNGTPPYVYSLVGTWPTGISIDSGTGEVSGTPTENGSFTGLSVRVTDDVLDTDDLPTFTLEVAAAGATIIPLVMYYRQQKEQPMQYLKQATASQSVLIGPFVDSTDGVTPETGLTIANTDIRLSANGGNMFAKTSGGGTHDELGMYAITFDATDTATVGKLQLVVAMAGALPVYHTFYVLEEAVYDQMFGASAPGAATVAALATVDSNVDAILVDTAEIGAAGAGLTEAGGTGDQLTALATAAALATVDGNVDAILLDTAEIGRDHFSTTDA